MTISLADINRVTLRYTFKPWVEQIWRDLGVQLPTPWEPTDEELVRLADAAWRMFIKDDVE